MSNTNIWDLEKDKFATANKQSEVCENVVKVIDKYGIKTRAGRWVVAVKFNGVFFNIIITNNEYGYEVWDPDFSDDPNEPPDSKYEWRIRTEDSCVRIIINTTQNKNSSIVLRKYRTCINKGETGTHLSFLQNALFCAFGAYHVHLIDVSSVKCGKNDVDLAILRIFQKKGSMYKSQGYIETDGGRRIRTRVADYFIAELHKITIQDINSYIEHRHVKIIELADIIFGENEIKYSDIELAKYDELYGNIKKRYISHEEAIYSLLKSENDIKELLKILKDIDPATLLGDYLAKTYEIRCDDYVKIMRLLMSEYLCSDIHIYADEVIFDTKHCFYLYLNEMKRLYLHLGVFGVCKYTKKQ